VKETTCPLYLTQGFLSSNANFRTTELSDFLKMGRNPAPEAESNVAEAEELPQHKCCFGTEFTRRFLTCDAWNPFTGPRWNVNKLRWQLVSDIILTGVIFLLNQIVVSCELATDFPEPTDSHRSDRRYRTLLAPN